MDDRGRQAVEGRVQGANGLRTVSERPEQSTTRVGATILRCATLDGTAKGRTLCRDGRTRAPRWGATRILSTTTRLPESRVAIYNRQGGFMESTTTRRTDASRNTRREQDKVVAG